MLQSQPGVLGQAAGNDNFHGYDSSAIQPTPQECGAGATEAADGRFETLTFQVTATDPCGVRASDTVMVQVEDRLILPGGVSLPRRTGQARLATAQGQVISTLFDPNTDDNDGCP